MQLRSGTTTAGRTPPATPQDEDIPESIEVVNQGTPEGQVPTQTQGVYMGGTYHATLGGLQVSHHLKHQHIDLHSLHSLHLNQDNLKKNSSLINHMRIVIVQNLQSQHNYQ
jgi:hypothetical protein